MNKKNNYRWKFTHQKIKDSFVLLLADNDISKIAIIDICRCADIDKKTFYNHFDNKADLLIDIEQENLEQIRSRYMKYEKGDISNLFMPLIYHVKKNQSLFNWLLCQFDYDYSKTKMADMFERYFKIYFNELYSGDDNMVYYYIGFHSSLVSCLKYWIKKGCQDPESFAEIITECLPLKVRDKLSIVE